MTFLTLAPTVAVAAVTDGQLTNWHKGVAQVTSIPYN